MKPLRLLCCINVAELLFCDTRTMPRRSVGTLFGLVPHYSYFVKLGDPYWPAPSHRLPQHFSASRQNQIPITQIKNQPPISTSNRQPVHKIRHGVLSASIWRQE